jgi:hypothetical protein
MANDREDLKTMADRLRGLDQKTASEIRQVGKQLADQVGKLQDASEIKGPSATPKAGRGQPEASSAERHRHVKDQQQKELIGGPRTDQAAAAKTDKNLAEMAQKLREAGVTQGRAANDVAPPKQTPAVERNESRGRGR